MGAIFIYKLLLHFEYVTGIYNFSFAMLHNTYLQILVYIIKMEIDFFEMEDSTELILNLCICMMNIILVHIIIPFENSNKIPGLQR